ncbi:oxidoreductase, aldo/keto reductase family protein [Histomonas meleagridis]|uniref:oxidoreductase, aldo/keto reductase family protein n=1 Tax=Histomonas meleagridis TaxID=135588 RepID=UPI003559BF37|nr:oxidoreductase, aldo/keto reductase family protein [Histomonas meleagridis]KAH0804957.1 oxidoreductase, aldo/keto reductase family protein [Histomonas meleagridis]
MDRIPTIGLGTWKSPRSDELVNAVIYAVKEAGYVHIDCAACYENEDIVGQAFEKIFASGIKREQLWVTSKLWNTCHRPEFVEPAIKQTLKDLKLDYLDLYLMHYPCAFKPIGPTGEKFPRENGEIIFDRKVSFVDTWKAMEQLVEKGLTKHIGVSNFTINQLEILKNSDIKIKPYTNQIEFHLYMQQKPLRRYLHDEGIILTGYSTLGSPDWAQPDQPVLLKDPVLVKIAEETGRTVGEVELKFLNSIEPSASLLCKSVTPERIYKNNHLDFNLTPDQVQRLVARERFIRYCSPKMNWNSDELGDGW